jgi:periplasmic protein TonB
MSRVASSAVAGERLAWAVFLAAAAHGVLILGLGFSPPGAGGPEEVPTLEVTLLDAPLPDQPVPADARYLAQASQEGAGNVEEQVRPEFYDALPAPATSDARERGEAPDDTPPQPEDPAAERVASWNSWMQAAIAPLHEEAEPRPAEAQPDGGVTRVTATGEREYFVSVSARESLFAEYLASWKARMERIGTLNFPAAANRSHSSNPVLEVAVAADGTLKEVRVTQSSGHGGLDQAAVDLVRLASPYDRFPPAVRAQYDVLRFAYEWRFIEGRAAPGTLRATPH